MKTLITTLALAAFAVTPILAGDKDVKHTPEEKLAKLDTDKDGKVSLDEFKAGMQKDPEKAEAKFKKKDADHDGFVTLEEMKAGKHHGDKEAAAASTKR